MKACGQAEHGAGQPRSAPRGADERRSSERGSATVLVAAAVGVVLILLVGALSLTSAVLAATQARTAADQAALAGADGLLNPAGAAGGHPCAAAAALAMVNHARLLACRVEGEEVVVRVAVRPSVPRLGGAVAQSRAGPDLTLGLEQLPDNGLGIMRP